MLSVIIVIVSVSVAVAVASISVIINIQFEKINPQLKHRFDCVAILS